MKEWLFPLFGFITLLGVCKSETCYRYDEGFFQCSNGCCGNYGNEYCCDFPVYIIVLAVIGGIVVISVGVCLVCFFCVKHHKKGRVIQPSGQIQPTAPIQMTSYSIVQPPPYGMPQPPPPAYPALYQTPVPQPQEPPPPEGLQSQPPTQTGLPGNHQVV